MTRNKPSFTRHKAVYFCQILYYFKVSINLYESLRLFKFETIVVREEMCTFRVNRRHIVQHTSFFLCLAQSTSVILLISIIGHYADTSLFTRIRVKRGAYSARTKKFTKVDIFLNRENSVNQREYVVSLTYAASKKHFIFPLCIE